jgi:hypothetical protein
MPLLAVVDLDLGANTSFYSQAGGRRDGGAAGAKHQRGEEEREEEGEEARVGAQGVGCPSGYAKEEVDGVGGVEGGGPKVILQEVRRPAQLMLTPY